MGVQTVQKTGGKQQCRLQAAHKAQLWYRQPPDLWCSRAVSQAQHWPWQQPHLLCSSLGTLGLLQLQLEIEVVILQLLMLVLEVLHHRRLLLILPLQGLQQAACHTQWSAAGAATQHRLHTMASHERPPTETRSAGCLDMSCSRLLADV